MRPIISGVEKMEYYTGGKYNLFYYTFTGKSVYLPIKVCEKI